MSGMVVLSTTILRLSKDHQLPSPGVPVALPNATGQWEEGQGEGLIFYHRRTCQRLGSRLAWKCKLPRQGDRFKGELPALSWAR